MKDPIENRKSKIVNRVIFHLDMDAFYASVEQLDNPELKGKCVIVGGSSKRGVVSASSYEARKFGVRSAMPIFQAKKLCRDGVFLTPRMGRYREVSAQIMSILEQYTPLVEPVSIDEAYMDVTGCEKLQGTPGDLAAKIKTRIKEATGLTCSVGVAPTKFLAKVASDMNKPDGLTIISVDQMMPFIERLPIRKIPGVGEMTQQKLNTMGIRTLGDVKSYAEETLLRRLGKFGKRLMELAAGIDTSPVTPTLAHKSVSAEETLTADTDDKEALAEYLLRHSEDVARQLRKLEVWAKTITLKIKHADFKQVTRSTTLSIPTRSSKTLFMEAKRLLDAYPMQRKVRLVGVGASGLLAKGTPVQMSLFGETDRGGDRWEAVDRTVDAITQKFGNSAVRRATLKDDG